ncbi:Transmembrane protein 50B [Eumeta japonica]|uniref:Transmembrane protein 50B n=1 Tax=Eumeta variegata TaxID=151549 RepID=A0A4C1WXI0_EUMVA|nr:Transmembrane protein 50B [Eumeta japonica]
MPSCVWFEGGEKRNVIASMLAGLLFFSGWWFIIDTASVYPHNLPPASYVCGVFGTLSLVMVNSVSNAQGPIVKAKVENFAEELDLTSFKASEGRL